tara:strand:- start:1061 stop:2422 length:1362 start_codon:yes stop_codon:yes gene_type:complete
MTIAVVGGGPCGIFTATLLATNGHSVTLFHEGELGGSHRVDWVNSYFSEHGPRGYFSFYVNYIEILRYLNIDFYDYHSLSKDKQFTQIPIFTPIEYITLLYYYVCSLTRPQTYKKKNILELCANFTNKSKIGIKQLCNLIGNDSYNCWSFFALVDLSLHKLYYVSQSYDKLWKLVTNVFKENDGIIVSEKVTKLIEFGVQTSSGTNWYFENVIICTPPSSTYDIISNSAKEFHDVIMPLNKLKLYSSLNSYPPWISCTIHFDHHVNYDKCCIRRGLDGKEWAIISLILSEYIKSSGTIISCCFMELDKKSITGVTANNIENIENLKKEIARQVCNQYNINDEPNAIIINPKVFRSDSKWSTVDIPYVQSPQMSQSIGPRTRRKGLYWVGSHNGRSNVGVNTMESTCENLLKFCTDFSPSISTKIKVKYRLGISNIILICLLFGCIYILMKTIQ